MNEFTGSGITFPKGFVANGIHSGIKEDPTTLDLGIIYSEVDAVASGVFTKNKIKGAPVIWSRSILKRPRPIRALIANSGNSNVVTENGLKHTRAIAKRVAKFVGLPSYKSVLVASTGVIGQPLPIGKILTGIDKLIPTLSPQGYANMAKAIMTTDTFPKERSDSISVSGQEVRLGGIAKGSGMIAPDMATMLAFITTDANISKPALDQLVKIANQESFSNITVDGDSSTSDMFIVMANGASNSEPINTAKGEKFESLLNGVIDLAKSLAIEIVKDGEGATKFITVEVSSAKTKEIAFKIAKSIGSSLLVKTALFGEDANWGRILMAAGNANVPLNVNDIKLLIGNITIFENGRLLSDNWEMEIAPLLKNKNIDIKLDLKKGKESATIYTTDISYEYIKINADYRT